MPTTDSKIGKYWKNLIVAYTAKVKNLLHSVVIIVTVDLADTGATRLVCLHLMLLIQFFSWSLTFSSSTVFEKDLLILDAHFRMKPKY